jgi:hypothetical protein
MDVSGVTPHPFRMLATVPEDMVCLPADGEWAAWLGVSIGTECGRSAVILVSITVTAFVPQPGASAGEALATILRDRLAETTEGIEADDDVLVKEFTTVDGNPGAGLRRVVTQPLNGRDVTTGQAQALVAYPGPGALGVVSGLCLHPDDLDRAAELVTEIAAGMTVTGAPVAA